MATTATTNNNTNNDFKFDLSSRKNSILITATTWNDDESSTEEELHPWDAEFSSDDEDKSEVYHSWNDDDNESLTEEFHPWDAEFSSSEDEENGKIYDKKAKKVHFDKQLVTAIYQFERISSDYHSKLYYTAYEFDQMLDAFLLTQK